MKMNTRRGPLLEDLAAAWGEAPADRRAEALAALNGSNKEEDGGVLVVRWAESARRLGITVRALRYAVKAAGISPIRLPGRGRAIGIRARDLRVLAGVPS